MIDIFNILYYKSIIARWCLIYFLDSNFLIYLLPIQQNQHAKYRLISVVLIKPVNQLV